MDLQRVYKLLELKLLGWADALVVSLPNAIAAIVVLILFFVGAKLMRRTTVRLLKRFSSNENLVYILGGIAQILVVVLGLFVALGVLKLDRAVSSLLAGAGILGLALGFAFREVASNYLSGIILAFQRPFIVGDIVEIRGHFGAITKVGLGAADLRTPQGQIVVIPNREVYREPLKNYSRTGLRRIDLPVMLPFHCDLEKAATAMTGALEGLERRMPETDFSVLMDEAGEYGMKAMARYWIEYPGQQGYFEAKHEGLMAMHKALSRAGIEIAVPVRKVDLSPTLPFR
tara:strand:+ start:30129 stop:30989 length:861 start_codon:yes stop_codon:yes gene_type:complete